MFRCVVLFILAAVIASAMAACAGPTFQFMPPDRSPSETAIARENQLPGTTDWQPTPGHRATTQIQAYAGSFSVQPGRRITFYVSVAEVGSTYTLAVYRLGWYGGDGGRLQYITSEFGQAQGYYDAASQAVVDCATCRFDADTNMMEADWKPSVVVTIPNTWLTGVYLAKVTDGNGFSTYVPFDVTGNATSTYVAVTADSTVAAYNRWGGHSFYGGIGDTAQTSWDSRAKKVSLNRPIAGAGLEQGLLYEIDTIRWMERLGYDVSYMSDIDLDLHPRILLGHRAFISLGHDEYWSANMRAAVEHARDVGIGLAFIGGNDMYWQIRFEPDRYGSADRIIICYKDPGIDPLYRKDNAHLSVQWRDPLVGQPENRILGIMYSGNTGQPQGYAWSLGPDSAATLLRGTELQPGQQYGCDLVGYEWDRLSDNGATPSDIHIIGASPTVDTHNNTPDISNTAYYFAPSGAFVFDAGSVAWSYALDGFRLLDNPECRGQQDVVPQLQRLMANVMVALVANHPPRVATQVATAMVPSITLPAPAPTAQGTNQP